MLTPSCSQPPHYFQTLSPKWVLITVRGIILKQGRDNFEWQTLIFLLILRNCAKSGSLWQDYMIMFLWIYTSVKYSRKNYFIKNIPVCTFCRYSLSPISASHLAWRLVQWLFLRSSLPSCLNSASPELCFLR